MKFNVILGIVSLLSAIAAGSFLYYISGYEDNDPQGLFLRIALMGLWPIFFIALKATWNNLTEIQPKEGIERVETVDLVVENDLIGKALAVGGTISGLIGIYALLSNHDHGVPVTTWICLSVTLLFMVVMGVYDNWRVGRLHITPATARLSVFAAAMVAVVAGAWMVSGRNNNGMPIGDFAHINWGDGSDCGGEMPAGSVRLVSGPCGVSGDISTLEGSHWKFRGDGISTKGTQLLPDAHARWVKAPYGADARVKSPYDVEADMMKTGCLAISGGSPCFAVKWVH